MMELLLDPAAWIAFLTLVSLEIVLGIDNIVFLSILVGKLPSHQQELGRLVGLSLALLMRIILLLSLSWVMQLTAPLFTVMEAEISGRDLILILGGFFCWPKAPRKFMARSKAVVKTKSTQQPKHRTCGVLSFRLL